ncbi:hypothetical protein [Lysinibacillus mangiferihumi]|uniref:hypothetical protein n=1 Tax=Lysinibacillus mangiferihumi TaxID=1130819 RepID=UPI00142E0D1B|nr:hypothetical protein [Lysinibacillus mangiferihumi]
MKQGTLPIFSHLNLPVVSVIILVINAMKSTQHAIKRWHQDQFHTKAILWGYI